MANNAVIPAQQGNTGQQGIVGPTGPTGATGPSPASGTFDIDDGTLATGASSFIFNDGAF